MQRTRASDANQVGELFHVDGCSDCEAALQRWAWPCYTARCDGCSARLIARSPFAFDALHERGSGSTWRLRDLIERTMSHVPTQRAKAMVFAWWKQDEANKTRVQHEWFE